jgi:hypothetical protein
MVRYQNAELPGDQHAPAGELMTRVEEAVREASARFNATIHHEDVAFVCTCLLRRRCPAEV